MKAFLRFLLVTTLALPLARLSAQHHAEPAQSAATGHPLRGVVSQVLAEKKLVLIKHEEIPGFMKAMTMAFHVPESIFTRLRSGTLVAATLLPKQPDGWHLTEVRVLAASGVSLTDGVPYRVTLAPAGSDSFAGTYAFTPPASGNWRICVSSRAVWVDLSTANGESVASKACSHTNPEGFAKGPLYALTAGQTYTLRFSKAPASGIDVLFLPLGP